MPSAAASRYPPAGRGPSPPPLDTRCSMDPRVRTALARHRWTIAIALLVALTSSATAAAVSYVVLGGTNSATTTTTIRSAVNAGVLQVTNTNTAGDRAAKGIGITVPAGRPPITVNAAAGKATNL